jgi:hypothetical protein
MPTISIQRGFLKRKRNLRATVLLIMYILPSYNKLGVGDYPTAGHPNGIL